MPCRLREIEGQAPGATHDFKDVCVIGRALDCQVHVRDLTVSRRHARISRMDGKFIIEDLGSGNGTFVNGEAITRRLLQDQDEIRISETRFRFEQTRKREDSVTMAGPNASKPRIVTTVDARPKLLERSSEAAGAQGLQSVARRLKSVYAVSEAISNILDLDDLLPEILDRVFDVFPKADRGFIMLRDREAEQLIPKAVKRRRTSDLGELVVSRTILHQVLRRQHAVLSHDASEDHRFREGRSVANYGIRAMIAAPLVWRGEPIGIIYLDSPGIAAFQTEDLELLSGLAQQAAVAIANARLHDELLKRQRLERDLHLAERIQQSFLPRGLPSLDGYAFAAHYDPAYEVGGDLYDFLTLDDDRLAIVVGDVAGKGVSAALYMARLTRDLHHLALAEPSPSKVLARLNGAVLESGQDDIFVTLTYGVLDRRTNGFSWSSAGHMAPILCRAHTAEALHDEAGLPLGVMPDASYADAQVELAPGDAVLMYTDGLVEAMNSTRDMFGVSRLLDALADGPVGAEALLERAITSCARHVADAPQFDDTTVVAVERVQSESTGAG